VLRVLFCYTRINYIRKYYTQLLTKLQCYKRVTHEVTHCHDRVTHEVTLYYERVIPKVT
jgi:hypothetical protein